MKTKACTMKTKARITLLGLVMIIALCYVNFANAESNSATGTGATASARLDFQIVIPHLFISGLARLGQETSIQSILAPRLPKLQHPVLQQQVQVAMQLVEQ